MKEINSENKNLEKIENRYKSIIGSIVALFIPIQIFSLGIGSYAGIYNYVSISPLSMICFSLFCILAALTILLCIFMTITEGRKTNIFYIFILLFYALF